MSMVKGIAAGLALFLSLTAGEAALAQSSPPPAIELRAMTWMEIREAVQTGKTRVIVPTGGIEQNGPHMALDKHDHIVGFAAREIAARLGDMLVAPVISFVPQGDFSPPSGNMMFPGTIGISDAAFDGLLDGVARSMRNAGFRTIILIGDHGPSQAVQARVAQRLTREWRREGIQVLQIEAYYDDRGQITALEREGVPSSAIGSHAGLLDTSELMAIAPGRVTLGRLVGEARALNSLGASGEPQRSTAELGKRLIEMRIAAAVAAIRRELGLR
jgi:creatinine amidohydrolase/Fe(II)-dependent formamide hydrolase-like protein